MSHRFRPRLRLLLPPIFAGVLLLALWYLAHAVASPEKQYLVPPPHIVARAFVDEFPTLIQAAASTAAGAAIGFLSAVAISFALAIALAVSPLFRASLYPYLMMLQMTPIIVFAPILILFVGPGLASVSIITFLISFFPLVVNTTRGMLSVDEHLVDFFRMCRATKRDELLRLRVPAALPYFFTGLRIAATLAPIGAVVGDYTAGNAAGGVGGLGFMIIIYSARFQMAALYATAIFSCFLGFLFVAIVLALEWLALHRWHDAYQRTM